MTITRKLGYLQYTTKKIADIINGKLWQLYQDTAIEQLLLDSRKTYAAGVSLFFAFFPRSFSAPRRFSSGTTAFLVIPSQLIIANVFGAVNCRSGIH